MKIKYIVCFVLITIIVGCAAVQNIENGDLYDFSREIVITNELIDDCNITINSKGFMSINFLMTSSAKVENEEYLTIFKSIKTYITENMDENGSLNDKDHSGRTVREIMLSIEYPSDNSSQYLKYSSHYYGGDTIYSDDELNTIDNFITWYGPLN